MRGYERISIRVLPALSSIIERLVLERRFRRIWSSGWQRLRRMADEGGGARGATTQAAKDTAQHNAAPDDRPRTSARG